MDRILGSLRSLMKVTTSENVYTYGMNAGLTMERQVQCNKCTILDTYILRLLNIAHIPVEHAMQCKHTSAISVAMNLPYSCAMHVDLHNIPYSINAAPSVRICKPPGDLHDADTENQCIYIMLS